MGLNFNIFIVARLGTLLLCFIFSIAGTSTELMKFELHEVQKLDFYFTEIQANGLSIKYSLFSTMTGCSEIESRVNAGLAFAIIGILAIVAALITVGLLFTNLIPKLPLPLLRIGSTAVSVFAFVSIMISWAIVVSTYHSKICGSPATISEMGGTLGPCPALLITTWIILLIDVVLGIVGIITGQKDDMEASKGIPMLGQGLKDEEGGSSNQPVLLI